MAQMDGGGGCPGYETLVPELPFDFLQPPMVRGLTQAGNGGPYVVRGNPIGAVFDAIRAFCFPVPMEASSDGTQYTDLSGSGLSTYGTDLGALGQSNGVYTGPASVATTTDPNAYPTCKGQMPDYSSQMCVPIQSPGTTQTMMPMAPNCMMSCDPSCLDYWTGQLEMACQNYDSVTAGSIAVFAKACSVTVGSNKSLATSWANLAQMAGQRATNLVKGKQCDGTPKPMMPMMAKQMPSPSPPASGNPAGGNTGGPFGYIPASNPGGANPTNSPRGMMGGGTPTETPMTVTNPPPNTPTMVAGRRRIPRTSIKLPELPNPMSLTEGNIGMMPSANPMGGSFDPARIEGGRLNRRPMSFSARHFFRGRGF